MSVPIEPIASAPVRAIGATQDAQLLLGVAEGLLAAQHRLVRVHDVLALGQVVELDAAGVQPLVVRVLGGELRP